MFIHLAVAFARIAVCDAALSVGVGFEGHLEENVKKGVLESAVIEGKVAGGRGTQEHEREVRGHGSFANKGVERAYPPCAVQQTWELLAKVSGFEKIGSAFARPFCQPPCGTGRAASHAI